MTTNWTPGEWRACVWDPMERPHVHADIPGQRVCAAKRDLPLTADDARLMAAAKKLYEALTEVVERRERACRENGYSPVDGSDGRYARAKAALRSARGDADDAKEGG